MDDRVRTKGRGSFTGKLVPEPSIRPFVFKPEVKSILKIKDETDGRSKTERLKGSMENFRIVAEGRSGK